MSTWSLFLLAVGLAMDATAVSICKGLALRKPTRAQILQVGAWFGGFQALMPVLGYALGSMFASVIQAVDHWIAFILLALIGANMVRESRRVEQGLSNDLSAKTMLLLAVATSIDALAVGVTLAFLQVNIWLSAFFIGVVTFAMSAVGAAFGSRLGERYGRKAELAGGIILICLGLEILFEHLGVL